MQDEEGSEQGNSWQRGSLLERPEATGEAQSWYGMPQVKGLKELKVAGRQRNRIQRSWQVQPVGCSFAKAPAMSALYAARR
jgi:hypothetical protein